MHTNELPVTTPRATFTDVVHVISKGELGIAIVKFATRYGIITDGDIRRAMENKHKEPFDLQASDIVTNNPLSVLSNSRVHEAISLMESKKVNTLLVIDNEKLLGVIKK